MQDLEYMFYSLIAIPGLIAALFIGLAAHYVHFHRIGKYHRLIAIGGGLFVLGAALGLFMNFFLSSLVVIDNYILISQINRLFQSIGLLIFSFGVYKLVQERSSAPTSIRDNKGPFL